MLLGLVAAADAGSVLACECKPSSSVDREFSESKAVFAGEVVSIDKSTSIALITFKVEKSWKGDRSETIVIRTDNGGKACGYIFTKGERYLVYATETKGALWTSICSRTVDSKSADEDVKKLNSRTQDLGVMRAFGNSSAVFAGQVIEIDESEDDNLITFKVERIWKGTKAETIVVRTDNHPRGDGYSFKQGEKYLVFADDDSGNLRTGIFTRTAVLLSADEDVEWLNTSIPMP